MDAYKAELSKTGSFVLRSDTREVMCQANTREYAELITKALNDYKPVWGKDNSYEQRVIFTLISMGFAYNKETKIFTKDGKETSLKDMIEKGYVK